jgi:hypothetical protein
VAVRAGSISLALDRTGTRPFRPIRVTIPDRNTEAAPAALAEEWIAPFVEELGPPTSSGRWLNILLGHPLEFWRNVSWTLEPIDLRAVFAQLTFQSNFAITVAFRQGLGETGIALKVSKDRSRRHVSERDVERYFRLFATSVAEHPIAPKIQF